MIKLQAHAIVKQIQKRYDSAQTSRNEEVSKKRKPGGVRSGATKRRCAEGAGLTQQHHGEH